MIDADGTDEHRISPVGSFDFDPAWSPDGQRIAFASMGAPDYSIDMYAMDPDGTDRVQLSHTPGLIEEDPAWSPDGSRIAFSGVRPGKGWNVFMMPAEGPGHHIVVDALSLYPAWYPDGIEARRSTRAMPTAGCIGSGPVAAGSGRGGRSGASPVSSPTTGP